MDQDGSAINPKGDVKNAEVEEGYMMLPYTGDQFNNFIKNLLGSPQSITRVVPGSFDVTVDDFRNIHTLLMQRISQQNKGLLINFSAVITFSDDYTVKLNTIDSLITYNEIRPVHTTGVQLKWEFLVKYEDKDVPEKQTIQVSFDVTGVPFFFDEEAILPSHPLSRKGVMSFRIEHTARTWGADIDSLLTNHLKTLAKSESQIKKFIRKKRGKISMALAAIVFLGSLVGAFLTTRQLASIHMGNVVSFLNNNKGTDQIAINNKIDYLSRFVVSGMWTKYYFAAFVFVIASLIFSIILGAWCESAASSKEPSFIIMSRHDNKIKSDILKKLEKKWLSFTLSIVVGIITGIISNIIFCKIFT